MWPPWWGGGGGTWGLHTGHVWYETRTLVTRILPHCGDWCCKTCHHCDSDINRWGCGVLSLQFLGVYKFAVYQIQKFTIFVISSAFFL